MAIPLNTRINLDANATFGVTQRVLDGIKEFLNHQYGNASAIYYTGQAARIVVEEARLKVARLLGEADLRRVDITFTSGASESNNWALANPFLDGLGCNGQEMVVLAVEHPSITSAAAYWQGRGVDVRYAFPTKYAYSPTKLLELVTPATSIVSIMSANNETGHCYPVAQLIAAIKQRFPNILVHVDAVQSLGKEVLEFWSCGCDTMAISGHKIGALSGVGALVSRKSVKLNPLIIGGAQEVRRRAGTENLLGIFSFGLAAEETTEELALRVANMRASRQTIENALLDSSAVEMISSNDGLPNTSSVWFKGVSAADLVVALDLRGIEVSYGSACASGKQDHSPVLTAIGLSPEQAREVVRISVRGREDRAQLLRAAQIMVETANQMRGRNE